MTDRELLELAAKAAGITLKPMQFNNVTKQGDDRFIGYMTDCKQWARGWFNPLADDGDALRLAVKLVIDVECHGCITTHPYAVAFDCKRNIVEEEQPNNGDPYAATRRAIVRAAAEIGRNIK